MGCKTNTELCTCKCIPWELRPSCTCMYMYWWRSTYMYIYMNKHMYSALNPSRPNVANMQHWALKVFFRKKKEMVVQFEPNLGPKELMYMIELFKFINANFWIEGITENKISVSWKIVCEWEEISYICMQCYMLASKEKTN